MIDSNGVQIWPSGGIQIQSGAGYAGWGCLIASELSHFIAGFEYSEGPGLLDVRSQKFDTSGTLLWGSNGAAVCDYSNLQSDPLAAPDGQGGAIFFWADFRDGSGYPQIYGQRMDADGNRLWNPDGLPIVVDNVAFQGDRPLPDGQGGAFFAYAYGLGYTPWVGRINGSGQILWTHQVGFGGSGYGGIDLVPDDQGGIFAIWSKQPDDRIYAQHYTADGRRLWPQWGLPVSNSPGQEDYNESVSDNAGGFIVVWWNFTYDNIYASHVTSGAQLLWGLSDVLVCGQSAGQQYPLAAPDGYGGLVTSWADYRNTTAPNLYGQRVLSDGILGNFPEIEFTVTPLDTPIVIPASGGSFQFLVTLQNNFGAPLRYDFWTNVLLPNGSNYGPLFLRNNVLIGIGGSLSRILTQAVPGSAPAGQYLYGAHVGDHPVAPWDEGNFIFTKLGSAEGGEWACSGWDTAGLDDEEGTIPAQFALHQNYPNPFNASTAISYQLSANSYVSLRVYNPAGRLAATLVDGYRSAGTHELTFDASHLPSGMYFARLEAGEYVGVQKLILLK
jgi:hypothetical protein